MGNKNTDTNDYLIVKLYSDKNKLFIDRNTNFKGLDFFRKRYI